MIEAMCDNETWGIRTTSVVRSVGIVVFEGRNVLEKHYFRIDEVEQCAPRPLPPEHSLCADGQIGMLARTTDRSTASWWSKPENTEAQATIALAPLVTWDDGRTICGRVGDKVQRIWAKPAMFDLPMLRDLFGQDIWAYWKECDLATLLAEFDPARTTRPKFEGVQHNALDDAVHAHTWLCDLRDRIPRMIEEANLTSGGRIWSCKIGECDASNLNGMYAAADPPMRDAVKNAYRSVTGLEPKFLFSGWGGRLDKIERQVADAPKVTS